MASVCSRFDGWAEGSDIQAPFRAHWGKVGSDKDAVNGVVKGGRRRPDVFRPPQRYCSPAPLAGRCCTPRSDWRAHHDRV